MCHNATHRIREELGMANAIIVRVAGLTRFCFFITSVKTIIIRCVIHSTEWHYALQVACHNWNLMKLNQKWASVTWQVQWCNWGWFWLVRLNFPKFAMWQSNSQITVTSHLAKLQLVTWSENVYVCSCDPYIRNFIGFWAKTNAEAVVTISGLQMNIRTA